MSTQHDESAVRKRLLTLNSLSPLPGRQRWGFARAAGPSFVAASIYMDPGNFAVDISAGTKFGGHLIWLLLVGVLLSIFVQSLAAKIGISTQHSLPELQTHHFPRGSARFIWLQAEVGGFLIDVASFIGVALGLTVLLQVPIRAAGGAAALLAVGLAAMQEHRPAYTIKAIQWLMLACTGLVLWQVMRLGMPKWDALGDTLKPTTGGPSAAATMAAIVGSVVIPQAIYLHSASGLAVPAHDDVERRVALRYTRVSSALAWSLVLAVNVGLMVVAAHYGYRHAGSDGGVETLRDHIDKLVGGVGAVGFAAALLASGVAASTAHAAAGRVVTQGAVGRYVSMAVRKSVSSLVGLVVLLIGASPGAVLVGSQIAMCVSIPLAVGPLVLISRRRDVMGAVVNRPVTTFLAAFVFAVVTAVNGYLLLQLF